MLHHAQRLIGSDVHATDGAMGQVDDLFIDTDRWTVRYLVVSTGEWLGRRVLLSPMAVREAWGPDGVRVNLTREQVGNSPDADPQQPLSRDREAALLRYYGHPLYWGGADLWGAYGFPAGLMGAPPEPLGPPLVDPPLAAEQQAAQKSPAEDPQLQSLAGLIGHHIHAVDGDIGHVDDFLVDDASWQVRYVQLDTSNWIGGRAVAVSPRALRRIDRAQRLIHVDLSRDAIRQSPPLDSIALAPGEDAPPFVFI